MSARDGAWAAASRGNASKKQWQHEFMPRSLVPWRILDKLGRAVAMPATVEPLILVCVVCYHVRHHQRRPGTPTSAPLYSVGQIPTVSD